jgi:hypothetical protein
MSGGYLPPYLEGWPICPVGIHHHISIVDWWLCCNILVCHSSPICLVVSNMSGGYLPPYIHCGLVIMLQYFGLPQLSNMSSGYLPPYLQGGLVVILVCHSWPICLVDIYHHTVEPSVCQSRFTRHNSEAEWN